MPISEAARELLQKRTGGKREILLGMDAALSTGAPATLAVGLLLVPITLFIAVILPGKQSVTIRRFGNDSILRIFNCS